jgi:WD40 repeat protein
MHPNGRWLVWTTNADHQGQLCDLESGGAVAPPFVEHQTEGVVPFLSRFGDAAFSNDWHGVLRMWEPRTGRPLLNRPSTSNMNWLVVSHDNKRLGLEVAGRKLRTLRFESGREYGRLNLDPSAVRVLRATPNCAVAVGDSLIAVKKPEVTSLVPTIPAPPMGATPDMDIRSSSVSPDGRFVAVGLHTPRLVLPDQCALVYGIETSQWLKELPTRGLAQVRFSPRGNFLAVHSGETMECRIFDCASWELVTTINSKSMGVFSPDETLFAIECGAGEVSLRKGSELRELAKLSAPDVHTFHPLLFAGDNSRMYACSSETRQIHFWNLALIRKGLAQLNLAGDWPEISLASSPDVVPAPVSVPFETSPERTPNQAPETAAPTSAAEQQVVERILSGGMPVLVRLAASQMFELVAVREQLPQAAWTLPAVTLPQGAKLSEYARQLAECPQLKCIVLGNHVGLDLESLGDMARSRTLEELAITNSQLSNSALTALANHPSLTSLGIQGTQVTGNGLLTVTTLPILDTLLLDPRMVDEAGIQHLANCRSLTSLVLSSATDEVLARVAQLRSLDNLSVSDTLELSRTGLAAFAGLSRPTKLHLRGANISDGWIDDFSKLQQLRTLTLDGVGFSAEGIERLKRELPGVAIHVDRHDEKT